MCCCQGPGAGGSVGASSRVALAMGLAGGPLGAAAGHLWAGWLPPSHPVIRALEPSCKVRAESKTPCEILPRTRFLTNIFQTCLAA